MELSRIMVFDRLDAYVCDLNPERILDLVSVEEINGEHALTITTTHQLEKTNRIVLNDGMGVWHEYVVAGIVDTHETMQGVVTEYYCVWSIQYDLSGTFVNDPYGCGIVPGHASVMHPARDGLTIALSTTNRWQVGTVAITSTAAASFFRMSGWEGIQTVVEKWGGEIRTSIEVGTEGVTTRKVDLLQHLGASEAVRRFDYGHDVASIKRTVSEDVWPCRIVPLGASQETDEGGYTRRPTIESVNDGVMWLEDADAAPLTRIPDGKGGWEYPTVIVENDTYEQPADLKAWALANITDYTRPKVTYEASVVQLARAGMNPHGVALGDEVVVVDREFGGDGLRIAARVVKQECNLLDPTDTVLTIGNVTEKLSGQLSDLSRQVSEVAAQVSNASSYQSTGEYLSRLLERLNTEANATGGYTYITEGQGIRTYDAPVSDPMIGAEARAVCEIKGGTMRIANSRDVQGQWEWKTVFKSGRILSELIDAIGASTGFHAQLTPTGMDVYDGETLLAHYGDETEFYDNKSGQKLVSIGTYSEKYREGKLDFGDDLGFISGRREPNEQLNAILVHSFKSFEVRGYYQRLFASGTDVDEYGDSTDPATVIIEAYRQHSDKDGEHDYAIVEAHVEESDSKPAIVEAHATHFGLDAMAYLYIDKSKNRRTLAVGVDSLCMLKKNTTAALEGVGIFPEHGTVAQSVGIPANSYHDFTVEFDHIYDSPPDVQLTILTTTSATTSYNCDIYLRSKSTTGFVARIVNRENVARSPGFCWFAIG